MNPGIKGYAICREENGWPDIPGIDTIAVDRKLLPAALRRRSSLCTRMAVSAAVAACEQAGVRRESLVSVFASVGGEIQVTDDLCRELPDTQALISPTRFHNSVHNTTAGYWSILNCCQAPTTAIASVTDVFAIGLLEAWSQLMQGVTDILLVCYDERWPHYLAPPVGEIALAAAFVLSSEAPATGQYSISVPALRERDGSGSGQVDEMIRKAPVAACLPLLQALQAGRKQMRIALGIDPLCWHVDLYKVAGHDRNL